MADRQIDAPEVIGATRRGSAPDRVAPMEPWPPRREDVALRYLLESAASVDPSHTLISFDSGERWSAEEALEQAYGFANGLRAEGVRQGDAVVVMGSNSVDFVRAWWGVMCLGGVMVPLNPTWRGSMLRHALETAEPRIVVAIGDEVAARVVECGAGVPVIDPRAVDASDTAPTPLDRPIEPWDPCLYPFTSGTTGPSKAAVVTNIHHFLNGSFVTLDTGLGPDDVYLVDLPLTHVTALVVALTCVAGRIQIALREKPALSAYWDVARETGATASFLMSSMVPVLMASPPSELDRAHGIRMMIAAPLPSDTAAFADRFGVETMITGYGMTEIGGVLVTRAGDPIVEGTCGHPRPGWELRLVDDHDLEVPVGDGGELVVRCNEPWGLSLGYLKNPEATVSAHRNGWFHTGDLMRCDANGNHFFVDRLTDALRRRGENISSYEVEAEVIAFASVAEVACVGVPSPSGVDQEVKVFLVAKQGSTIDFRELATYLAERLPHYMVPRYYQVLDALPTSPTMKVLKYELRGEAYQDGAWDLELDGRLRPTAKGMVPA